MGFSVTVVDDCRHNCLWLGLWLSCVCLSRGCFVSALRLSGSTADLGTGLSESARCALGWQKPRQSRRLLLSTGVICVFMLRVSWVELVWVGPGWFRLSCWVVEPLVDEMCGCLRLALASAWSCGAVCGAYCASPWVVCCVRDDWLVLSCCVFKRLKTLSGSCGFGWGSSAEMFKAFF